ncbi:mechanosensitive ion channel family protein [Flavimarina sp. Hel_I_48]|uniref:mechanosensitive ion channel family protein n=1 Tax=Flavimarina sp. Hel_I_48 TaxID=1392488 RepID=UPI00056D9014|nr:mechanosensitive ion channel domain-containing protein [Flavimarina sp. Hel_I_48]
MQLYFSPEMQRFLIFSILITGLIFTILYFVLKKLGKNTNNILPLNIAERTRIPLALLLVSLMLRLDKIAAIVEDFISEASLNQVSTVLLIISFVWLAIIAVKVAKAKVLENYDIKAENNIKARKIYTQFNILERVIIFVLVLLGIGIVLMSFDNIRAMGVTMLSTAGIAGIIIGFAAQKALGTLMAGIQIAFTQPIRIDDVVIVEGEWGRIEEITLTYVVVNIWDKRRLVVPTTYFIEQPFQNWTRSSSDLLGTVFIYTDYNIPFDDLREELTRLLKKSPLWDQKVNVLQVTDSTANSVEIRALMSAKDSPTAFDLRVYVRENLISFIQRNYPESFSKTRFTMPASGLENQHPKPIKKVEKQEKIADK